MEATIYPESLVSFLLCLLAFLIVRGMRFPRRNRLIWLVAGFVCSLAALTRPSLQVIPLAVVASMLVARYAKSRHWITELAFDWKSVAAFSFLPALLLGGYGLFNTIESGYFRLALGRGFSLLNYVGHPELYTDLPPDLSHIQGAYLSAAESRPGNERLGWGVMLQPVLQARREAGEFHLDWDEAAFEVARAVIASNPIGYLRVWSRVGLVYLTSYSVSFGLFPTQEVRQNSAFAQIPMQRYRHVRFLETLWKSAQPIISLAAVLLPPLMFILVTQSSARGRPTWGRWLA